MIYTLPSPIKANFVLPEKGGKSPERLSTVEPYGRRWLQYRPRHRMVDLYEELALSEVLIGHHIDRGADGRDRPMVGLRRAHGFFRSVFG